MAKYESRLIKGWRGLLDDIVIEIKKRIWTAPASIVYYKGVEAPSSDSLGGSTRWFNRVFGPERLAASADLRQLKNLMSRIRRSEFTDEQREKERARHQQWRAKQSDEWRREEVIKKRMRVAAKPELYKAIEKRSKERTKDARNERRRLERNANLEEFRNRERAYKAGNRERTRATTRARYARDKARRAKTEGVPDFV